MRRSRWRRWTAPGGSGRIGTGVMVALWCLVGAPGSGGGGLAAQEVATGTTVYLVRHSERAPDHPSDPTLTAAGTARSALLARMLRDVELVSVLSTDYRRTRLTAGPTAELHGLAIESYDPRGEGMEELVDRLRSTPGHHLVVGHSNTTPAVVEALGGDPVSPIEEDEYDRLYIVVMDDGEVISSALLRFGEPWAGSGR